MKKLAASIGVFVVFGTTVVHAQVAAGTSTAAVEGAQPAAIAVPVEPPLVFPDVPNNSSFKTSIEVLKRDGIISGYGDGTFRPLQPVSRAEAIALSLKSAGVATAPSNFKLPFLDVPTEAWFYPMIQKGVALGKVKGYADKTFRPGNAVTLPEALAFLCSFYNINTAHISVDPIIYSGLSSTDWYATRAQYAKNMNLIAPNERGYVDAAAPVTRERFADLVYRMREVVRTGKAFDITQGWIESENLQNFWRVRHPAFWQIFKGTQNSVLWRPTEGQMTFGPLWPESVRLTISTIINNPVVTVNTFFDSREELYKRNYGSGNFTATRSLMGSRQAMTIRVPNTRIIDSYVALPNNNFLVLFGEYGSAPLGEFFRKQLELVVSSYQYVYEPPAPVIPVEPLEKRMEKLREKILIQGAWKDLKDSFPDKRLIHTDGIGVGTGPVDYYFSKEANTTIKLERNSGTVLNIREGQTTGF